MTKLRLLSIMNGEADDFIAGLMRAGLAALEPIYAIGVRARNLSFDLGLRQAHRLARPVVSVGNLTVGGTGKTPVVCDMITRLRAIGHVPAVLLRGYGAGDEGSDEARLHAQHPAGPVPVGVNSNRMVASRTVLDAHPEVSIFLLDDAFQHRQVYRDLNVVLVDASAPYGFNHLLPRGLLREPVRNLRRADAIIVTHVEQVDQPVIERLDDEINRLSGAPPLAHMEHRWTGFRRFDDEWLPPDALAEARVAAFCGIANPQAFQRLLRQHVASVHDLAIFPDHHAYPRLDGLLQVMQTASSGAAEAILTTEKDWIKVRSVVDWSSQPVPLYRAELSLAFRDGEAEMETKLQERVPSPA